MKIIREIYSEWGTLINKVTVEGTTLKKLSEKYNTPLQENKVLVLNRGGQTVIYKKK